jgi:hypothetical protein
MTKKALVVFIAMAVMAAVPSAMYVLPILENVPVDRLVANLERIAAEKPADAQILVNLARVHMMAFAKGGDELEITKGKPELGAWYGFEPPRVPRVTRRGEADAEVRAHLAKAIARYEQALTIAPGDMVARVGHAWAIEKSGDSARAIELYRAILRDAWESEQNLKSLGLATPITPEVAGYLIPLLDRVRDAEEIQAWRTRRERIEKIPRAITPIAIPLRANLAVDDIVAPHARVRFDADGTGLPRTWSWITPDAGWLVYDQRGTAQIDSALQLFGGVTFWLFWDNGYQALGALDDDANGRLEGEELRHLAIWRDADSDGVSDRGEVRSLADWKIVSLSTAWTPGDGETVAAASPRGVTFASGETRPTWDVMLYRSTLGGK